MKEFTKFGLLTALLCSTAVPAMAQGADAVDAESGEIVVTAQGRAQVLKDVPVSVSVTLGETLERGQIRTLEELSARTPNFRIGQSPTSDFINMRGIGSSANQGFEQSVPTFVDGVYRGRAKASRGILFDVERVEVLRGPQTTFFGNNAIGGALNIATRKPGAQFEGNVSGYYAPSPKEYTVDAGLTIPVSDTLALRVAGRLTGMSGYIYNATLDRDGPRNRDAFGRASVRWEPSSNVSVNARLDLGRMRDDDPWNVQLQHCPPASPFVAAGICARYLAGVGAAADDKLDRRSDAGSSYFDLDFLEAAGTVTIDLDGPKLLLTSGYQKYTNGMLTETPAAGIYNSAIGTAHGLPVVFNEGFTEFQQEIRLQSPEGGTFDYMIGAYYLHTKLTEDSYAGNYFADVALASGGYYSSRTPIAFNARNLEKSETLSAFAAVTFRPAPGLRLNGGLRYSTTQKRDSRVLIVGSGGDVPGPSNFVAGPASVQALLLRTALPYDVGDYANPKRRDSRLMPSVSIQYDVNRDVMVYASYTNGFKAGGYSMLVSKAEFGPESVNSFEAGIKSFWFDRRLSLDITAFTATYRDLQETINLGTATGTTSFVANVGRARARGIEFASSLRVNDILTLRADLAYLDSRYLSYPNAPCSQLQIRLSGGVCVKQDLSGVRRAFAPEWSGSAGFSARVPVGDYQIGLDGTVYFTSMFYQTSTIDIFASQPGNAKIDARLSFGPPDGRWELAVVGKNLTNYHSANYRLNMLTSLGTFVALEDQPRSIGFQASYKF